MEVAHQLQLGFQFRNELLRKRNGSIFIAFTMYCEYAVLEIEILHSKAEALEETESATIKQADYNIEWVFEMSQNRVNSERERTTGIYFDFFARGTSR